MKGHTRLLNLRYAPHAGRAAVNAACAWLMISSTTSSRLSSAEQGGLVFGDCFAYALGKTTGEPLLFKKGDFARTDIALA